MCNAVQRLDADLWILQKGGSGIAVCMLIFPKNLSPKAALLFLNENLRLISGFVYQYIDSVYDYV